MKIFISSVISGYEDYRSAAVDAIETLGHNVIRAEDFPAAPDSPQQVCLAGVRQADIVVLIIGERYGYLQASGLSATHEEYREARDRCRIFAFVQEGVTREPQQKDFLHEVQSWNSGQYTANFATPDELKKRIIKALHQYDVSQAAGPVNEQEMLDRAMKLVKPQQTSGVSVVVTGGPLQNVLRPAEIEDPTLSEEIIQQALFGSARIFTHSLGTEAHVRQDTLIVKQNEVASLSLNEVGSVRVVVPVRNDDRQRNSLPVIIEEEITERIASSLRFIGWLLDRIDSVNRLSDVVIVVGLFGGEYMGWQTRAEHQASGNSIQMNLRSGDPVVHLSPARRSRAALSIDVDQVAKDLTVRLRREVKGQR